VVLVGCTVLAGAALGVRHLYNRHRVILVSQLIGVQAARVKPIHETFPVARKSFAVLDDSGAEAAAVFLDDYDALGVILFTARWPLPVRRTADDTPQWAETAKEYVALFWRLDRSSLSVVGAPLYLVKGDYRSVRIVLRGDESTQYEVAFVGSRLFELRRRHKARAG